MKKYQGQMVHSNCRPPNFESVRLKINNRFVPTIWYNFEFEDDILW